VSEKKATKKKKLLRRLWFWAVTDVVLLFLIVLLSANYIIARVIERRLVKGGASDASTDQVLFNPFAGSLTVESLHIAQGDINMLKIGTVSIRFRLLALLERSVEIKEIIVKDIFADVTLQQNGDTLFGGITIPVSGAGAQDSRESEWTYSLESIRIVDSSIQVTYGDERFNIAIGRIEVGGIDSLQDTLSLEIDLKATLNGSPIGTNISIESDDNATYFTGDVKIRALDIASIASFLPIENTTVAGNLHIDTQVELMIDDDGSFHLLEDGLIKLNDVSFMSEDMIVETGEMKLKGQTIVVKNVDEPLELNCDGQLHTSAFRMQLMENSIDAGCNTLNWQGTVQILAASNNEIMPHIKGDLFIDKASIREIGPEQIIVFFNNLHIPDITINTAKDITLAGLSATKVELFQSAEDSRFAINTINASKLIIKDLNTFNVELVEFNDLSLTDEGVGLGIDRSYIRGVFIDESKKVEAGSIQIDGIGFETGADENILSCTIEQIEVDNATYTDGFNLALRTFALHGVDLRAGPHHLYLNGTEVRNTTMQGTNFMSIAQFNVNSLVILESTDKRVLKEVQSSFPLSLTTAMIMNIELTELKHLQLESVHLGGLTTILRRSENEPLSIAGIYNEPSDTDSNQDITFSINRVSMLPNCKLIFVDDTVSPLMRLDLTFDHFDVRGIGSNRDKPLMFSSKIGIGSYSIIAAEGSIKRNTEPPDLELVMAVDGLELPKMSPYVRKHMGYRIEQGQLSIRSNFTLNGGKINSLNNITVQNAVMVPEETELSEAKLSIYAKPFERALKVMSDKNNTLSIDIPVSGDLNNPNFDLSRTITAAVTTGIRTAIQLMLGVALWPYSGVYIVADLASSSLSTADLEPVYFSAGKSDLSEGMKRYLKQIAQFLDEHPKVDISLCSVATASDRKRFSNEERMNRLSEKRAGEVKAYLIEHGGIEPNRLFLCLPEFDSTAVNPGYVDLKI
jgi:flagellar motor protein MotB